MSGRIWEFLNDKEIRMSITDILLLIIAILIALQLVLMVRRVS